MVGRGAHRRGLGEGVVGGGSRFRGEDVDVVAVDGEDALVSADGRFALDGEFLSGEEEKTKGEMRERGGWRKEGWKGGEEVGEPCTLSRRRRPS